jgi:hypothetical protein
MRSGKFVTPSKHPMLKERQNSSHEPFKTRPWPHRLGFVTMFLLLAAFASGTASSAEGDHLTFTSQPSTTQAGIAINPAVQVAVQDANGDTITSSTLYITLVIESNPGNGTLFGTYSVQAIDGIATFSDLWIDKSGTGYTLSALGYDVASATSSAFEYK